MVHTCGQWDREQPWSTGVAGQRSGERVAGWVSHVGLAVNVRRAVWVRRCKSRCRVCVDSRWISCLNVTVVT